jgi:ABC-type glycerol-3-phosphate transport system permease component
MEAKKIPWSKVKHHWEIYLFVIPTLVMISLFLYYPASQGIFRSFYRWNGADIVEWVGTWNYSDLLTKMDFWVSFRLALVIGIWNIIKMLPALLVAVCIHRCRSEKMQFFYRILFVVPMVIPGLVTVLIWRAFFFEATSGYLNKFLYATGLFDLLVFLDKLLDWGGVFVQGQPPAWLGDPNLILAAAILWGFPWVGSFAVLTYLAKLQSIDKQIYEAAEIDGSTWWSKFTRIEMPLITGSIYIMLVFTIIGTISDAGMVIALAGIEGGPGGKLTVPAVFMLRKAFTEQQMGYACAVGIVLTLIVLFLQKVSQIITNWENMTHRQKTLVKIAVFAGGSFLIGNNLWTAIDQVNSENAQAIALAGKTAVLKGGKTLFLAVSFDMLTLIGLFFVLLTIPWSWIHSLFVRNPGQITARQEAKEIRSQQALDKYDNPLFRLWLFVSKTFLRLMKHSFIWLVLVCAFIPVYLMVIVSLKNNQQFYENPTTISLKYLFTSEKDVPAAEQAQYKSEKLHWENWKKSWDLVSPSVANSIFMSTTGTILTLIFSLCAAYYFARLRVPMSGLFWNAILILMMMPMIANLVPLFILLGKMKLLNTYTAIILVGAASGQMFAIFVLRNFVADIPQGLFDAADIDGASHFQQIKNIVLPLSGPILGTVGVMNFITAWNEFVLAMIVMNDQNKLPITVQLLRMMGEYIKDWGPLMAGYAITSIPVVILFIFSMKLFIKGMTEGAVKG